MSLLDDDEGPSEWEIKDEEPPPRLQKKWEQEEASGAGTVICPSCKKETPAGNLTCIFCGAALTQDSCPVSCLWSWIKRFFKKN